MGQAKIIDCGGPAFPADEWDQDDSVSQGCIVLTEKHLGMTLRDYFAAKAMQGDWASQGHETTGVFSAGTLASTYLSSARMYYLMADAMIAERSK